MEAKLKNINAVYYKSKEKNFGDDLNLILLPKILPEYNVVHFNHDEPSRTFEILKDSGESLIYFIGTILDDRVVKDVPKFIFGSGVGYGQKPQRDDSWNIIFVRGPQTARALGCSEEHAVTDPAYLIRDLDWKLPSSRQGIGYIPHHSSLADSVWEKLCSQLGLKFIDPRNTPEEVAKNIAGCEKVICEAMHGAIFADALRTPWVAVRCSHEINSFKWNDFCDSVGLEYNPTALPSLHYPAAGVAGKLKRFVKAKIAKRKLLRICEHSHFNTSDDEVMTKKLNELRSKVEELKAAL